MTDPAPPDPVTGLPDPFQALIAALLGAGFSETYREHRPDAFGSAMWVYERDPVRIRLVWDGKESEWLAQLNARSWPRGAFGDDWVTLPPTIKIPR